jgi:hypothetical protein
MKTFKLIDVGILLALVIYVGVLHLAGGRSNAGIMIFLPTAWHTISIIIHKIFGWFSSPGSKREIFFEAWAYIILFFIPLMFFFFLFWFLYFLLPALNILYILMCWGEIKAIKFKELIHLK